MNSMPEYRRNSNLIKSLVAASGAIALGATLNIMPSSINETTKASPRLNSADTTEDAFKELHANKILAAIKNNKLITTRVANHNSRNVARQAVTKCIEIENSKLDHTLPENYVYIQLACELAKNEPWAKKDFESQMDALTYIWDAESGWNPKADNPNSSAYGIPQALPGSKMGAGWRSDPIVQIKWGLRYIAKRYGNPKNAWQEWKIKHWY